MAERFAIVRPSVFRIWPLLTLSAKAVAVAIAGYADKCGRACISTKLIQIVSGLKCSRSVFAAISELEGAGVLAVVRSRGRVNRYQFAMQTSAIKQHYLVQLNNTGVVQLNHTLYSTSNNNSKESDSDSASMDAQQQEAEAAFERAQEWLFEGGEE